MRVKPAHDGALFERSRLLTKRHEECRIGSGTREHPEFVSSRALATKQFSPATKPFCPVEANVPKPAPGTHFVNDAPQRRMSWRSNRLKTGDYHAEPVRADHPPCRRCAERAGDRRCRIFRRRRG